MIQPIQSVQLAAQIRDLQKHYVLKSETVRALRGVSFDVPKATTWRSWDRRAPARARC